MEAKLEGAQGRSSRPPGWGGRAVRTRPLSVLVVFIELFSSVVESGPDAPIRALN